MKCLQQRYARDLLNREKMRPKTHSSETKDQDLVHFVRDKTEMRRIWLEMRQRPYISQEWESWECQAVSQFSIT